MTKPRPRPVPQQAHDGMSNQVVADYVKTFNTPHGRRCLAHIERRAYSAFRIDQHPTSDRPNPAYMNPDAALYRSAQIDVVQKIKRTLRTAGIDVEVLEEKDEINSIEEG